MPLLPSPPTSNLSTCAIIGFDMPWELVYSGHMVRSLVLLVGGNANKGGCSHRVSSRIDDTEGSAYDQPFEHFFFFHVQHRLFPKSNEGILLNGGQREHDAFAHLDRKLLHRIVRHQLILPRDL